MATRKRFAVATGANFPLLSDPTGETVRAYGAMGEDGLSRRITVLIGPDGTVQGVDRNVDSTIRGNGSERTSLYSGELALILSDWRAALGAVMPRFIVPDRDGRSVCPRTGSEKAAALLVIGDRCRYSSQALADFERVAARLQPLGVTFTVLIEPNLGNTTPVEWRSAAVPLGLDKEGSLIERLLLQRTPWSYLMDSRGKILYSGPWISGGESATPTKYGEELLDMYLSGRRLPLFNPDQYGTPVRDG